MTFETNSRICFKSSSARHLLAVHKGDALAARDTLERASKKYPSILAGY